MDQTQWTICHSPGMLCTPKALCLCTHAALYPWNILACVPFYCEALLSQKIPFSLLSASKAHSLCYVIIYILLPCCHILLCGNPLFTVLWDPSGYCLSLTEEIPSTTVGPWHIAKTPSVFARLQKIHCKQKIADHDHITKLLVYSFHSDL